MTAAHVFFVFSGQIASALYELSAIGTFIILSIVKFLYTPSIMIASGYSNVVTMIVTAAGGTAGVAFFFYGGKRFFEFADKLLNRKKRVTTQKGVNRMRKVIRLKRRLGVAGLALIVPLISIPVSAMIAAKYYKREKMAIPVYAVVLSAWSVVLTLFSERIIESVKMLF